MATRFASSSISLAASALARSLRGSDPADLPLVPRQHPSLPSPLQARSGLRSLPIASCAPYGMELHVHDFESSFTYFVYVILTSYHVRVITSITYTIGETKCFKNSQSSWLPRWICPATFAPKHGPNGTRKRRRSMNAGEGKPTAARLGAGRTQWSKAGTALVSTGSNCRSFGSTLNEQDQSRSQGEIFVRRYVLVLMRVDFRHMVRERREVQRRRRMALSPGEMRSRQGAR